LFVNASAARDPNNPLKTPPMEGLTPSATAKTNPGRTQ